MVTLQVLLFAITDVLAKMAQTSVSRYLFGRSFPILAVSWGKTYK